MKTQFIINAQTQFLRDTINHYNSANRSFSDESVCSYYPAHAGSDGCAIGRHINNKNLCFWLDKHAGAVVYDVRRGAYPHLPGQLQALGAEFLRRCQCLHDGAAYWLHSGLSSTGVAETKFICIEFGLSQEKVFSKSSAGSDAPASSPETVTPSDATA